MEFHWNWDQSSAPAVAQRNQEKVLVQPEMGSVKPALSVPLQGFLLPLQSHLLPPGLIPASHCAYLAMCHTRRSHLSSFMAVLWHWELLQPHLPTGKRRSSSPDSQNPTIWNPQAGFVQHSRAGTSGNVLEVSLRE